MSPRSRRASTQGLLRRRMKSWTTCPALPKDPSPYSAPTSTGWLVNDTKGHKEGDDLLKAYAGVLRTTFAGHDMRQVGGDEFAVILRGTDLGDGIEAMRALKRPSQTTTPGIRPHSRSQSGPRPLTAQKLWRTFIAEQTAACSMRNVRQPTVSPVRNPAGCPYGQGLRLEGHYRQSDGSGAPHRKRPFADQERAARPRALAEHDLGRWGSDRILFKLVLTPKSGHKCRNTRPSATDCQIFPRTHPYRRSHTAPP